MFRPKRRNGPGLRGVAALALAALSADCSVIVGWSDCTRDSDCARGERCNADRHYCEVPVVELCNGVDDNHNGVSDADETFGFCEPALHTPGACRDGVLRCMNNSQLVCVRRTSPGSTEICDNGIDDECDGTVDNGALCVSNITATMGLPIGSDNPTVDGEGDDAPLHRVCLDGFQLDKYEVSVQAYANYLSALTAGGATLRLATPSMPMNATVTYGTYVILTDHGTDYPLVFIASPAEATTFLRRGTQWGPTDPTTGTLPMTNVTWFGADRYCRWAGKHLPTEAEWWRAVKGPDFSRTFPWGTDPVTCDRANVAVDSTGRVCPHGLQPFDALPMGRSVEGVFNLYGNANEWMWDFHDTDPMHTHNNYYASLGPDAWCAMYPHGPLGPAAGSPINNPSGGLYCQNCRMLHGRNFNTTDLRIGIRRWMDGDRGEAVGGFRCSAGGADR